MKKSVIGVSSDDKNGVSSERETLRRDRLCEGGAIARRGAKTCCHKESLCL